VEFYLHAKFGWDSSIHGWDITTSGLGKRKAAILEFYFRFRFRSMYSHRHTIFHLPAKFRSNRMNVGGVMTSYPFFKMAAGSHIGIWYASCYCSSVCHHLYVVKTVATWLKRHYVMSSLLTFHFKTSRYCTSSFSYLQRAGFFFTEAFILYRLLFHCQSATRSLKQ